MSQTTKIQEDINKLIVSLNPKATPQLKSSIQDYCKKIFGSIGTKKTPQTAIQMKDKVLSVVQETSDSRTFIQCQQTLTKIVNSNTIPKKAEILKMLLKTSELCGKKSNSNFAITIDFSNMFNFSSQKKELVNQTQITMNNTTNNYTRVNQNLTSEVPSFYKPRKSVNSQQLQAMRNRGSVEQNISELDIIRQITYTMQNIEATFISLRENDTFQLRDSINVSETVRAIVSELCQIGWMYKRIVGTLKDKGSIEKSLVLAVQEELNEYYRWLAVIQTGIKERTLTLRSLINWSYEPMEKLKWLTIILESVTNYQGSQIISIINTFRPHGSQSINDLLNRLLGHLIQPLLQFIHNWMYKGQLIDQQKQFFVEEKYKVGEVVEWFEKYRLVETNIPNIIDKDSAIMIFNAGKTINFLKNRCRCNYSIPVPFINPQKILNSDICESSNILSHEFKQWLTSIYQNLSEKLINELKSRYHLKYHLESMKHFYLMGKGDFIQQLVDTLKEQLFKAKHLVYEHTLDGYISDAITKSFQDFRIDRKYGQGQKLQIEGENMKSRIQENSEKLIMLKGSKLSNIKKSQITFDNSYRANIIDRLLAKKMDFGSESTWDSFNFQYSMDKIQPLYSLLSPDIVQNYQRIFHFLWKIKRIQHMLKQVWLINQKQYPKTQKNKNLNSFTRILHRCHLLRSSMSHFVSNLYGYEMIAIESAWNKFSNSYQKSQSLDEMIREHRLLHNELSSITFASSNKKILRESLMNVFKAIEQFKNLQNKILAEYSEFLENLRKYENRRKIMMKGILHLEDEQIQPPQFDQIKLNQSLGDTASIYDKTFRTFFENLKKQSEDTSILVFRLDFSEYFANRQGYDKN